jgi:hypothetical protein
VNLPDEEREERFQRWKAYILKNKGHADESLLRYLWDLYDEFMQEITRLNNYTKNSQNGKAHN